jgi:hypothetical protein
VHIHLPSAKHSEPFLIFSYPWDPGFGRQPLLLQFFFFGKSWFRANCGFLFSSFTFTYTRNREKACRLPINNIINIHTLLSIISLSLSVFFFFHMHLHMEKRHDCPLSNVHPRSPSTTHPQLHKQKKNPAAAAGHQVIIIINSCQLSTVHCSFSFLFHSVCGLYYCLIFITFNLHRRARVNPFPNPKYTHIQPFITNFCD